MFAAFVDSQNLHRRHLNAEFRRQRAAELKQQGFSNRAIAEQLRCDEGTIRNDLKKAGAEPSAPAPSPSVKPVSPPPVVKGRDGKRYPAVPPQPAEIVESGRRLEAIEKVAKERQVELGKSHGTPSGKLPEGSTGQTRDKVAAALGVSGRTYEKAKAVVEAAEAEPDKFADLPNSDVNYPRPGPARSSFPRRLRGRPDSPFTPAGVRSAGLGTQQV